MSAIRNHRPQLPYGPLVYSRNRRYEVAEDDFKYGPSTSQEMEKIAQAIYQFHTPYDATQEHLGTDNRVRRVPGGPQGASRGTLFDLFVPLRALRLFADSNWREHDLTHIFSSEHWYELLRLVSMIYDQEYRYSDGGNSNTGFLSQERFFGAGCRSRDCSLSIIYQMYQICVQFSSNEDYSRFKNYESDDSDPDRLAELTNAYRGRVAYDADVEYDTDEDEVAGAQLCHVLPLHDEGLVRVGGRRRRAGRRRGWQTFDVDPYDERVCSRYVYWRGSYYVEVSVVQGYLRMETTAVPQSFIDEYDVDLEYEDEDEEGPAYYRLDKLIEDVNDGNFYAGTFLFSQVFSDNLVISGNRAAWSPNTDSGGEEAETYLNVQALVDVLGDLLYTDDRDIILPVSYNGMLCYLTRAGGRRSDDFYVSWKDVDYTEVTAQSYTGYDRSARFLRGRS